MASLGSLFFQVNSQILKVIHWDFDWSYIESEYQFEPELTYLLSFPVHKDDASSHLFTAE